jgi:hypothetical protein
MGIKVANNAFATLASGITSSATSITVASGQGARFPILGAGDYFYATLINTSNQLEIVKCTARSGDVLTVVRAQEATTARAYDVGDRIEIRITAATFEDATAIYDVPTESTGYLAMPAGTTAQRPGTPVAGATRFNTEAGSLEFYDGAVWISTNLIPTVNSVTGTIFAGVTSTLVLDVSNATETITVRFSEGGVTVADVANVTVSSGTYSVAVPAAVFNKAAGTVIAVSIINQDGTPSSNAINKTIAALPTGGTITTAGGFRYHTFTSSGNFVVPSGFSATADYLIVAGGGGGGSDQGGFTGGGGGAGGHLAGASSISAQTYAIAVGGGGAGRSNGSGITGGNGSNSSFNGLTAIGGGGGGRGIVNNTAVPGNSGGSGGGGGMRNGSGTAAGGSGTSGQGNAGGSSASHNSNDINIASGGGGGAGAAGGNGGGTVAGNGGNGLNWQSLGTFYAGGGGGATYNSGNFGQGGSGGGGNGMNVLSGGSAGNGVVNRGGGGGGGGPSGSGGSGIVIIRYAFP